MRIGILGSGSVGRALGTGFVSKGHDVKIGSRNPEKQELQDWLKETKGKGSLGTFSEAAAHGEILALCTLGVGTEEAIRLSDTRNFTGKIVIDATNPLDFSKGMPPGMFVGLTDSLGERVQKMLPNAMVVKCFNTVNNQTMINPKMKEGLADLMLCGNDAAAKRKVTELAKDFGWGEPIDLGGIEEARWLEAYTTLWVRLALKLGNFAIAARFLRT